MKEKYNADKYHLPKAVLLMLNMQNKIIIYQLNFPSNVYSSSLGKKHSLLVFGKESICKQCGKAATCSLH